jgi:hypothetical protein
VCLLRTMWSAIERLTLVIGTSVSPALNLSRFCRDC